MDTRTICQRLTGSTLIVAVALFVCLHPLTIQSVDGPQADHELQCPAQTSHFIIERHTKSHEDFSPKGVTLPLSEHLYATAHIYTAPLATVDGFTSHQKHLLYTLTTSSFL